ncbi:MAG: di-trans,poly-cis-decaprenylcistransferase [Spirochaetaceae bacterium]|nr:MAG: di-trans,poly-cis-decaprenylcistransferase [Spirochaetaceae bacterium]
MALETSSPLPQHVGIIMDGNGRWAQRQGKARTRGHLEGVKAAKRIVRAALSSGLRYLTLYTFSTENWKRTNKEVSYLMFLIKNHLRRETKFYEDNEIQVVSSGKVDRLPKDVIRELQRVTARTAAFHKMTLNLAIDYGGRDEILRAVNRALQEGKKNRISEEDIRAHLDHPQIPDPDLIIRTGDECRVSNFLIWQGAYSELYFSSKMWPDWHEADLKEALDSYGCRERRYGAQKAVNLTPGESNPETVGIR